MTTATHLDPRRPERTQSALAAHEMTVRQMPGVRLRRRAWRLAVLATPALWVVGVVALSQALRMGVQLTPLLAAAPALACAGSGRRQCILVGCACALLALVPLRAESDEFGERLGTAPTILVVTFASYLITQRRQRTQRAYDQVRRIAEVTQRVLLRPVPERIGPVRLAVEYLSAADGAQVGGDFYEVIETPYGVRAILGDMRGNGLDAVSGAAALLGAFREAGAVEPDLEGVAARLDAALARHAIQLRSAQPAGAWAEDFATAVLVQLPRDTDTATADEAAVLLCGHPSPYLLHGDEVRAITVASGNLPLGLGSLVAEPYATASVRAPFAPGDTLVLYTDGVSDARDRSGAFFPLDTLVRGAGGMPPETIAAGLRAQLLAHMGGGLQDDAALLVLRRAA
ncbi:serine/threonine-protein phosphatase [Actinocrinis puniceicyclus]|uniref:Serine/threonine-protein phosphatase n=1 Tax=Actinocrinis puniceicyclus TaxID=977794 RepID=A0A8J7WPK2_9ACTN|nr:PP2C family protein-serine/threonine phosphatase [Actinocrinis puniceicyclus]MBS2963674.1 serine/threonine-protein phosphatase [Actinocrinis puniceicyclus]